MTRKPATTPDSTTCLFCDDPAVDLDEYGQPLCDWHFAVWAEAQAKADTQAARRVGEQEL